MLMIFLDWWVWELMILLSGYLSVPEQAAQIVLMNIKSFLYMFGLGMEQAACAILGQQIGKGNNIKASKLYFYHMKEVSLFILILNSLLMYLFQEEILKNFTQNLEILVEARKVYWLICVTVVFEGFNCMLRGVIKAMNL